jgi:sterol desaturase/sphingolipid hydroxylase (fatty acid hydroxylase superfamily)
VNPFDTRFDLAEFFALLAAMTFLAVACWEALRPSRATETPMTLRWFGNISLFGLGWLILGAAPFLSAYDAALIAQKNGWGLFNVVAAPFALVMALGFMAQDLFGYWVHRLFHAGSPFWRLHAIHHSDTDLDVTTTIRHHPLEVVVQALLDGAFIVALGLPPQAVVLYGGAVLAVQIFHHGNIVLPRRLRWLGGWLITPDLHRLHHSTAYHESNSNFGNLIPLWDRLFGTLRLEPDAGFRIGLAEFQGPGPQRLDRLLIQPLRVTIAPAAPQRSAAKPSA